MCMCMCVGLQVGEGPEHKSALRLYRTKERKGTVDRCIAVGVWDNKRCQCCQYSAPLSLCFDAQQ